MEYQIKDGTKAGALEVYFEGKPDSETRQALKDNGARWNGTKNCWWLFTDRTLLEGILTGAKLETGAKAVKDNGERSNIKFLWNGIKKDGKLYKVGYAMRDNGNIAIYGRNYESLPRNLFKVTNESDIYTDYFCDDCGEIETTHPLYKYALFAFYKYEIHWENASINSYKKDIEKRTQRGDIDRVFMDGESWRDYYGRKIAESTAKIAKCEALAVDCGAVLVSDLEKLDQIRQEEENERKRQEELEEQKRQEDFRCKRGNGTHFINETMTQYPLQDGAPYVHIQWSEHPAFYNWNDKKADDPNALLLSITAAEIILSRFDMENANGVYNNLGYDKTAFTIYYKDENGDTVTYTGRYDLGDNEGGMINHIRQFGQYYTDHSNTEQGKEKAIQTVAFAEKLQALYDESLN